MNLWFRVLILFLTAPFRERIDGPFGVSRLTFRVWPTDLDTSMHMNNGRYWTLMDLGRVDLIIRSGLWRAVLKKRWTPVLTAGEIRFRRELRAFQRFTLETRALCWSDSRLVIEHRMIDADGAVAAIALVQAGFYDRKARAFVPVSEMMRLSGVVVESPAMRADVAAFMAAEQALKAVTDEDRAAALALNA